MGVGGMGGVVVDAGVGFDDVLLALCLLKGITRGEIR